MYTLKNVSHEAVQFMLCIQDRYSKDKCTSIGHNCVENALPYLINKALVYFHNLGFDGQFLCNTAIVSWLGMNNKICRCKPSIMARQYISETVTWYSERLSNNYQ